MVNKVRSLDAAFGRVLRELREKTGVSQEAFAHKVGVHRTYISQLERGLKAPSLTVVFAIAKILDVRPHRLVRLTEERLR